MNRHSDVLRFGDKPVIRCQGFKDGLLWLTSPPTDVFTRSAYSAGLLRLVPTPTCSPANASGGADGLPARALRESG
ncbi:MAG: hypothetical protein V2I40_11970 [Desulfobacteraceae bacterium]|nr:hypothetical protein [Desulfobacteraceae bacterium]